MSAVSTSKGFLLGSWLLAFGVLGASTALGAELVVPPFKEDAGATLRAIWPALSAAGSSRWRVRAANEELGDDPAKFARLLEADGVLWAEQSGGQVVLYLYELHSDRVVEVIVPGAAGTSEEALLAAVRLKLDFLLEAPPGRGRPWVREPVLHIPEPVALPADRIADLSLRPPPPFPPLPDSRPPEPPPDLENAKGDRAALDVRRRASFGHPSRSNDAQVGGWLGAGGLVDDKHAEGGLTLGGFYGRDGTRLWFGLSGYPFRDLRSGTQVIVLTYARAALGADLALTKAGPVEMAGRGFVGYGYLNAQGEPSTRADPAHRPEMGGGVVVALPLDHRLAIGASLTGFVSLFELRAVGNGHVAATESPFGATGDLHLRFIL